jgi:hypothetical protein
MAAKGLDSLYLVFSKNISKDFFSAQKKVIFPHRGG